MATAFQNSQFWDLIKSRSHTGSRQHAIMGGITGSSFASRAVLRDLPIVVFDFETTGLDTKAARIIEIGAVKFEGREEVDRFTSLVNPGVRLTPEITTVTGLTDSDLVDAPALKDVIFPFHDFLRGCVGVAHNAKFDCEMLAYESARYGIQCAYTVLCTLKLSRQLVESQRHNLDALAEHFDLTFQSRHRSIGDILVTADVLWNILDQNPRLQTVADMNPFLEALPVP